MYTHVGDSLTEGRYHNKSKKGLMIKMVQKKVKYLNWMALLHVVTQGPRLFLSSVIHVHRIASKVTLLSCIKYCFILLFLFASMVQDFPWA